MKVFPTMADARAFASNLNRDAEQDAPEDRWDYRVKGLPDGRACIHVHDEDGHDLGTV